MNITYIYPINELIYYMQQKKIIAFCFALFLCSGTQLSQAQQKTDNHFEVSKNLDIFNALIKELEMFYVDSVEVEKTIRRGIDGMLSGLDPYTVYYPEIGRASCRERV